MDQTARIISIYAADTSGFCSALYEYGGMTVIHDASGCNSTYTTHDEPRWYSMDSMMYISGLTESDAVMGNDEKFISDLCLAAEELKPAFIAICASALPAMVGIDMEAIAYEVETRTGIPAFEVKTNAMQSYITGAGNAFLELAKRFTKPVPKRKNSDNTKAELKVNILGLTPLDFPLHGTCEAMLDWLEKHGHTINSYVGMHPGKKHFTNIASSNDLSNNLDEIKRLTDADVNLVVSSIGMALAEYLYEEYGIPYVIGAPYGEAFSELLEKALRKAYITGTNINAAKLYHPCGSRVAIIGESITAASLAAAIYAEFHIPVRVLESVGDGEMSVLNARNTSEMTQEDALDDISCSEEEELENEIQKSDIIIADPLFEPICRGKVFIRLPHMAFSGRCFTKEEIHLINKSLRSIDAFNDTLHL